MGILWRSVVVFALLVVLTVSLLSQLGPFGMVELLLLPVVAISVGAVWYKASARSNVRKRGIA